MVNKSSRVLGLCVLILGFIALSMGMKAQNVVRNGKTFTEQKVDSAKSRGTKTDYLYTDKNGVTDTIYLSKNGNAFIWKVSKKTGKRYPKYLPKVTEQLGTKKDK